MREWTLSEVIDLLVTLKHAELEQGTVVMACDLEGTKTVALKPGQTLLNLEDREKPKLMKRVELAVRWEEKGCVYSMPYTSFEAMVDRGEIAKISEGLEEELGQQLATEKTEGDEPEEMAVGPGAEELPPHRETSAEMVRGFLIVRCCECGKTRAFNARLPIGRYRCGECGGMTPLDELSKVKMKCRKCKATWGYRTNSPENQVEATCQKCGEMMHAWWDKRNCTYHG